MASNIEHFKQIVEELKVNGRVDSGTKITFMSLLRDLDSQKSSSLHRLVESIKNRKKTTTHNVFFVKLVKLKFDLTLCSAKEFTELMNTIDNCAIKYLEVTNKFRITLRNTEHLSLCHLMGHVEATLEAGTENILNRAELCLKRLADAVQYRLTKKMQSKNTTEAFDLLKNLSISYNQVNVHCISILD